jgi:hypothetical protein
MTQQRDKNGRFVKGWKGGPGRPRRSVEEKFLDRVRANISEEQFDQMVRSARDKAIAGDFALFKLLLSYLVGLPTQYVSTDVTTGGKPIKTYTILANPDMWPDAEE